MNRWQVAYVYDDPQELEALLADGWEPFAAYSSQNFDYRPTIVLRRKIISVYEYPRHDEEKVSA